LVRAYYPKAQIRQGAEPNATFQVGADGETGDFNGLTLSNSGPVFRKPGLFRQARRGLRYAPESCKVRVQKITVAFGHWVRPTGSLAMEVQSCSRKIEAEAALEDCRALIDQINAELFTEEPFVNVSRAAELQLYLEFAASALKKAAQRL